MADFDTAVAVLGGLIVAGALVLGLARRSFPSVTWSRIPGATADSHSLNLESGMNDGLALPAARSRGRAGRSGGLRRLAPSPPGRGRGVRLRRRFCATRLGSHREAGVAGPRGAAPHQKSPCAFGVAFETIGITVLEPHGNGFIAEFGCAMTLGIRRPAIRRHFERRSGEIVEMPTKG